MNRYGLLLTLLIAAAAPLSVLRAAPILIVWDEQQEKQRNGRRRPGHETYKVFFEKWPLKIVENACTWLGESVRASKA